MSYVMPCSKYLVQFTTCKEDFFVFVCVCVCVFDLGHTAGVGLLSCLLLLVAVDAVDS